MKHYYDFKWYYFKYLQIIYIYNVMCKYTYMYTKCITINITLFLNIFLLYLIIAILYSIIFLFCGI